MRKLIISLLLASVASSPAMARGRSDQDVEREARESQTKEEREARESQTKEEREERRQAREERRQQPREESQPAKVEAPARADRPDRAGQSRQRANDAQAPAAAIEAPAVEGTVKRQQVDRQRIERQRLDRQAGQDGGQSPAVEAPAGGRQTERQTYDRQRLDRGIDQNAGQAQVRDARERVDARREQWDQNRAERIARQQEIRDRRPPVVSPTPRPGTQPPPPSARPSTNPPVQWSTNHWRKDRRYDWYKHRNRFWWLFQLGWYNDPFGWGYQPYGIGWRMWPSYYSSHYWLNDPWRYRLPYTPAGTRWIRYWDDAVLVDLWSGQVVDVIYNFFW